MNDQDAPPSALASPSRGVVYIAFGDTHIAEAIDSALSLRQHCPDLSLVLFTDKKIDHPIFPEQWIVPIDHAGAKVDFLADTPFDHTLYLDSDTQIVSNILDLFGLLERVDVALTQDFTRRRPRVAASIPEYAAIPHAFPEMNGSLLLYRRCEAVHGFLRTWCETFHRYRRQTRGWEQPSLRIALWQSEVIVHTLPIEYDLRRAAVRLRAEQTRCREMTPHVMEPRILQGHGLQDRKWWHALSAKFRPSKPGHRRLRR